MNVFLKNTMLALCLLILLFSVPACRKDTADTQKHEALTLISPTPKPDYSQAQAITPLDNIDAPTIPSVIKISDGKFAAAYSHPVDSSEDDEHYEYSTTVIVVDIITKEITAQTELPGSFTLIERTFSNGNAVLYEFDSKTGDTIYTIVDSSLNEVQSLNAEPGINYTFSYDCDKVYYAQYGMLFSMDLKTSKLQTINIEHDMDISFIESIYAKEPIINAVLYTSPFSYECIYAIVNLNTGEILGMNQSYARSHTSNGCEYTEIYNNDTNQNEIFYNISSSDTFYCFKPSEYGNGSDYTQFIPDSPFLLSNNAYTEQAASGNSPSVLYMLSDTVEICNLTESGLDGNVTSGAYMPEENIIVCYSYSDKDSQGKLWLLDIDKLEFTRLCLPQASDYLPSAELNGLSDYSDLLYTPLHKKLSDVRSEADILERKYNVHIFLSDQCEEQLQNTDRPTRSTADMDKSEEAALTETKLKELEKALSMYPEGFFEQMKLHGDSSGVFLFFSAEIESDYGVIAYTLDFNRPRFTIIIDITYPADITATVCHELWHAIEQRISFSDSTAFDANEWNSLNPEGFSYYESYTENEDTNPLRWTYAGQEAPIYFVDTYSKTFAKEDRARIMEYIMAYDYDAEELLKSKAINAKLKYISEAIRSVFDSSDWQNVSWEKYK